MHDLRIIQAMNETKEGENNMNFCGTTCDEVPAVFIAPAIEPGVEYINTGLIRKGDLVEVRREPDSDRFWPETRVGMLPIESFRYRALEDGYIPGSEINGGRTFVCIERAADPIPDGTILAQKNMDGGISSYRIKLGGVWHYAGIKAATLTALTSKDEAMRERLRVGNLVLIKEGA